MKQNNINIKMVYKIEKIAIKNLKPYERNAKRHPEEQVDQIAERMKEVGFLVPILIDEKNEIIAGHGRHLAAIKLGMKVVPCVRSKNLTPEQTKAFRIADNKVAESAWDEELVFQEISDLLENGIDIESTGFNEKEIADMIREMEEPERKVKSEGRRMKKKRAKRGNGGAAKSEKPKFRVMVQCRNSREKEALIERFRGEGLECWGI